MMWNVCAVCQPLHFSLQYALAFHPLKRRMIQSQRTTVGSVFCTDDAAVLNLMLPFCRLFHLLNQMCLSCEVLEVVMVSFAFLEVCVLVLVCGREKQILEAFWDERTVGRENAFLEEGLVEETVYSAFLEDLLMGRSGEACVVG